MHAQLTRQSQHMQHCSNAPYYISVTAAYTRLTVETLENCINSWAPHRIKLELRGFDQGPPEYISVSTQEPCDAREIGARGSDLSATTYNVPAVPSATLVRDVGLANIHPHSPVGLCAKGKLMKMCTLRSPTSVFVVEGLSSWRVSLQFGAPREEQYEAEYYQAIVCSPGQPFNIQRSAPRCCMQGFVRNSTGVRSCIGASWTCQRSNI